MAVSNQKKQTLYFYETQFDLKFRMLLGLLQWLILFIHYFIKQF